MNIFHRVNHSINNFNYNDQPGREQFQYGNTTNHQQLVPN